MGRTDIVDTIAALATAPGEAGIAVIRVSGSRALELVDKGFRGKVRLCDSKTHHLHFGSFVSPDEEYLDQVVASVYREPTSYTGEDVVEISCHGGVLVTRKVLESLFEYGCRPAAPGEFTKRAFLNGRMDLSQAEAVADLIHARSDRARRSSLQQLQGQLAGRISALREGLIRAAGLLELELDFAEEGLEFLEKDKVSRQIAEALEMVSRLIETYQAGRLYRDGVKVVLAGMPNVGKSSILNALLKQDRAIVTEVPGTTRDTIEESLSIHGLQFRIVDTAGLHEAVDRVEKEGIRRSEDQIRTSDLLLVIMDTSRVPGQEELELAARLIRDLRGQARTIVVLNKIDLTPAVNGSIEQKVAVLEPASIVRISTLTGAGMEDLQEALFQEALAESPSYGDSGITVTNARHYHALLSAKERLNLSLQSLEKGASGEFVSVDLRTALDALGEITGIVTTDDILKDIFSKFCIGK
ncbi:MAG: tRNA uridine-5-carboxymethylaminomethyl(34) synthesis GTPase MnmE [Ignavibacteriales bacterium]|nr:tRNA uridine-5-carboxymethylaminomethyl(34) synthesis GTPase MnmE [Ignavibacteriales bacterium]